MAYSKTPGFDMWPPIQLWSSTHTNLDEICKTFVHLSSMCHILFGPLAECWILYTSVKLSWPVSFICAVSIHYEYAM